MSDPGCFSSFFILASFIMAALALSKSKAADTTETRLLRSQLDSLTKEIGGLWKKVKALERALEEVQAAREGTDPGVAPAQMETKHEVVPALGKGPALADKWSAHLESVQRATPQTEEGPTRLTAAAASRQVPKPKEEVPSPLLEALPVVTAAPVIHSPESEIPEVVEPAFASVEAASEPPALPQALDELPPFEAQPIVALEGDLQVYALQPSGPEAPPPPLPAEPLPVPEEAAPVALAAVPDEAPSTVSGIPVFPEAVTAAAEAIPVIPPPIPTPAPASPPPSPRPAFAPRPQLPPLERVPPKPKRNLEDFLGTQLFLKAGVAILVIGVVFAMGIVFQKMGPAGKLAMGYLGALAMLAGGLYAERKPRYQTFGRSIIAGAWGILYFVTYAGGYLEASKVFMSPPVAILALLVAATAAVAFSLRYRNEWTTTSAFMLIFLGLGMAAWDLQPAFNLTATAIVAVAMAVLVWRTGWVRLLGFGVPATWGTLVFSIIRRPHTEADAGLMGTLLLCWASFQLVLIFFEGEEEREKWIGLSQIGNFLGGVGLCLYQAAPADQWKWAAGFGLANLAVAWAYARRGRRKMYLLAATEALAALGLVTPLRLGWRHHLTPVYRLVGVEVLLVGGVLLREKYFRRVAYGVFALTLLDILVLKLDPALGMGRTLLVGTGAGLWLLNAVLLRTVWREACQSEDEASSELPAAPYAFAVAGTLLLAILIWIEAPLKLYGVYYALVALLWLAVGWFKGYRDALALAPMLGLLASATVVWALVALPGAPGTVPARWLGATASALLLGLGPLLTRKAAHAAIPDAWKPAIRRCFACYGIAVTWVLLYQELPGNLVATGFALFALGLMAGAVLGKIRGLAPGALLTLAAALLMLLTRSAETHLAFWHLTYRGWSVLSVAGAAFSMEALVRSFRGRTLLTEGVWEFSRRFTSLAGFALLIFATNTELLPQWRATGLAALAVVHLGFGLWREYKDRAWQALLLFGGALLVLVVAPAPHTPGPWHITLHGWSLLGVGAMAFLFEWLIRRPGSEALFPRALRVGMTLFVTLSGLALGCFVLYAEMKAAWIAVGFGLSALLWLLLGLLWSHREKAYASFALLGLALFTLLTKPATMALGLGQITVWSWTLLGVGGCAFAMEFVTRREVASRLLGPETLQKGATLYTSLTGLSLGLLVLFKEAPTHWLAVSLAGLALLHFALGILWTHKDRAYEAMALLVLALVVLGVQPATTLTAWAHVTTRGWTLIGVGTAAFLLQAMVRIPASTRVLDDSERQGALWLYSLAGTGLALVVIWSEAPDAWIAPLMTGLSVLLLVLGLLLGFKEQVAGSVVTSLAGVWAVASLGSTFHGEWLHVSLRAWNLGSLALLSLGQEALLRAWKGAWKWSEGAWRWLTGGHSLKAAVFLGLLAWLEFKPVLVPGGLMLLGCVWMVWARKRPSVLHAYEAFAFGLGSFLAMGSSFLVNGWPLKGEWFGLPERLVAVGLGLLLAYGLQHEIHRAAEETGSEGDRLNHLMELDSASTAYLVLSSVALAAFVKAEANAHSRNEWVPLLWGAAALLHLGRGRALRQAQWLNLGHGLLGLGLVHILAMNLGLDDLRYGVSLRLWTCLPFLGMLLVPYAAWARLHENLAEAGSDFLRNNYLYAAQAVLAGTLLFELERPWVVAAWCLQALVTLLFGVGRNSVPWLRAASLLALVATLRAFTINFAHWGYGSTVGERMVVIPLASAALLAGYIRLRLWNPTAEEDDAETRNQALREGRHRLPWFVMQAALLMAYIWVEASGKSLTVWATLYGFGTVGLGFLYRERLARLLGLGVLSACTLKLFLWDLRGLHGLARVGSFIVLGIVLISVSYVYTRFKERLEHLL